MRLNMIRSILSALFMLFLGVYSTPRFASAAVHECEHLLRADRIPLLTAEEFGTKFKRIFDPASPLYLSEAQPFLRIGNILVINGAVMRSNSPETIETTLLSRMGLDRTHRLNPSTMGLFRKANSNLIADTLHTYQEHLRGMGARVEIPKLNQLNQLILVFEREKTLQPPLLYLFPLSNESFVAEKQQTHEFIRTLDDLADNYMSNSAPFRNQIKQQLIRRAALKKPAQFPAYQVHSEKSTVAEQIEPKTQQISAMSSRKALRKEQKLKEWAERKQLKIVQETIEKTKRDAQDFLLEKNPNLVQTLQNVQGTFALPLVPEQGSLQTFYPGLFEYVSKRKQDFTRSISKKALINDVGKNKEKILERIGFHCEQLANDLLVLANSFPSTIPTESIRLASNDLIWLSKEALAQRSEVTSMNEYEFEDHVHQELTNPALGIMGELRASVLLNNISEIGIHFHELAQKWNLPPQLVQTAAHIDFTELDFVIVPQDAEKKEMRWIEVKDRNMQYESNDPRFEKLCAQLGRQATLAKVFGRAGISVRLELIAFGGISIKAQELLLARFPTLVIHVPASVFKIH